MTMVAVLSVSGCFGDPAPDPTTAPMEIVVDGCALNRSQVGAGTHDVSVVGAGEVEIVDAAGKVVLSLSSTTNGQGKLTTTAQTYTVTCTTAAGVEASAVLSSTTGE